MQPGLESHNLRVGLFHNFELQSSSTIFNVMPLISLIVRAKNFVENCEISVKVCNNNLNNT